MVTIEDIRHRLAKPLPGLEGQLGMAPQPRPGWEWQPIEDYDCREAGVLLLLYPRPERNGELHLVLTRRHEYPGTHSGQISFPGGGREGDEPLETTALRETCEEIGVPSQGITILGQLTALYIPPSNYCIYPFVGFQASAPGFRPDPREVAEVIEVPFSLLLDEAIQRAEMMEHPQFGERLIPYFNIYGHKVWGATGMVLSEFVNLFEPNSKNRS
jgi:8-oxo-dGTP pyrophosphatase MutT (NUDIX family)